jgi:hypothetical protein
MSAPAGISHAAQWQAWTATWAYLLADEITDPAVPSRPLASAIDATTPAPSRPKATRAPLEDDHREPTTIDA